MSNQNKAQRRFQRNVRENLLVEFQQLQNSVEVEEEIETLEAHALLSDAVRGRATDLHMDPFPDHYRVRLRIDGIMIDAIELEIEHGQKISNQFKVLGNLNPLPAMNCVEGSFSYTLDEAELDLRVTAVPCVYGDKLAIRMLSSPAGMKEIHQLGISDAGVGSIKQWMDATGGMFLVAGPTGSGKTTTLYAILHELKLGDHHVVTLEDPVEYRVPGINQIQVDAPRDLTFTNGATAMLRLDPDYALIGEIRDVPSARAAIGIATSGRAMMATLHSRDAVGTVSALRNLGLDDYEIAANLGLVVAQRLVRVLCTECRERRKPDKQEVKWFNECDHQVPDEVWGARGCSECDGLGFRGRSGIFEVWQPTENDYAMILRHEDEHALRYSLMERGHPLMLDDGLAKVQAGVTTMQELLRSGTLLPGYKPVRSASEK